MDKKTREAIKEGREVLAANILPVVTELERVEQNIIEDLQRIIHLKDKIVEGLKEGLGYNPSLAHEKFTYYGTMPISTCAVRGCNEEGRHSFSFGQRRIRCCNDHYDKVNELYHLYGFELVEMQYRFMEDIRNIKLTKKR